MLLEVKDLTAEIGESKVLDGVTLSHKGGGSIHALMGPNGSGKSSLCNVLMGHPDYRVKQGKIEFSNKDISGLAPEERAAEGLFWGAQQPREIPGVSLAQVMRSAVRTRDTETESAPASSELAEELRTQLDNFGLGSDFLRRPLNEGASGGEKKRLEMVQLMVLKPRLAVLDEIDSGLDIDAIRQIAETITQASKQGTSFLLVTHYKRLLEYVKPEQVHIMVGGRIIKSGGYSIVDQLEQEGYKNLIDPEEKDGEVTVSAS